VRTLLLASLLLAAPKDPDVPAPPGFWKPLPVPKEGEWRDIYREEGQTLSEYQASDPVRPEGPRTTIFLLPCLTRPPSDQGVLRGIATFLAAHFGREVRILEPMALPAAAYDAQRRQFDVQRLVPRLRQALPADGLFLLAVTDRDLRLPRMSYAYGWGSFRLRVGIVSLCRLESPRAPLDTRRRVLSIAAHEAGHCLSMAHCTFYRCLMNGARTLEETDERPLLLCPVCEAKVRWNLGGGAGARYAEVGRALADLGLARDSETADAAADATRAAAGP
jgi:archaemetzincin